MARTLGTKPLNRPHIGIRNQVSNMGLSSKGLSQVIGKYIRACLFLSCREFQKQVRSHLTQDIVGFRANDEQLDNISRAIDFMKTEGNRTISVTVELDEDKLDGITRYLLFNKNKTPYLITPKNGKWLKWNPIDQMTGQKLYDEVVFSRRVVHPRYMSHNRLGDLPSISRTHTSVSRIFRENFPRLKEMVKEALVGELNGRR